MSDREFDVIVHGASGFTGRLIAQHIAATHPDVPFAMAGRNADKLATVRAEIGAPETTPLVIADSDDKDALVEMCKRAKVIIAASGPYQLYGDKLVAACVETGTDYVDLCGEPAWMAAKIAEHDAAAKESGARIVFSCGFDSVPSDIGVVFLQRIALMRFGKPCNEVKTRVRAMKGAFSGGTAASFAATVAAAGKDPALISVLRDPFSLTPGFSGPEQPVVTAPTYDEESGEWLAPFIMEAINTKNVHRSNQLQGFPYGEDFKYSEAMIAGEGDAGKAMAEAIAGDTSISGPDAPKPGEGPSKEDREAGFFEYELIGTTPEGGRLVATVTGDMDPGYGSTSKMISECALRLTRASGPGGVMTPAPALGADIISALTKYAGLKFDANLD